MYDILSYVGASADDDATTNAGAVYLLYLDNEGNSPNSNDLRCHMNVLCYYPQVKLSPTSSLEPLKSMVSRVYWMRVISALLSIHFPTSMGMECQIGSWDRIMVTVVVRLRPELCISCLQVDSLDTSDVQGFCIYTYISS